MNKEKIKMQLNILESETYLQLDKITRKFNISDNKNSSNFKKKMFSNKINVEDISWNYHYNDVLLSIENGVIRIYCNEFVEYSDNLKLCRANELFKLLRKYYCEIHSILGKSELSKDNEFYYLKYHKLFKLFNVKNIIDCKSMFNLSFGNEEEFYYEDTYMKLVDYKSCKDSVIELATLMIINRIYDEKFKMENIKELNDSIMNDDVSTYNNKAEYIDKHINNITYYFMKNRIRYWQIKGVNRQDILSTIKDSKEYFNLTDSIAKLKQTNKDLNIEKSVYGRIRTIYNNIVKSVDKYILYDNCKEAYTKYCNLDLEIL